MTSEQQKEKECQLLLAETEHVNKQISGYMGLQIKLLAFVFAAFGGGLGLLFATSDKEISVDRPLKILVVLSLLGSFAILQTVITYGVVLTNIDYKTHVLGPKWQAILGLRYAPLDAAAWYGRSPVKKPTIIATIFLVFGAALANLALVTYLGIEGFGRNCADEMKYEWGVRLAVVATGAMAVATVVSLFFLRPAMNAVGLLTPNEPVGASRNDAATED